MNDYARDVLKRLIDEFGVDLARDIHKLGALLRDECGECKREINVILGAAEEDVVEALRAPAQASLTVTLPVLARRLHETRGTDEAAARWVVHAWAYALGLETSSESPTPLAQPLAPPAPAPWSAPADSAAPADAIPAPASNAGLVQFFLRLIRTPEGKPRWIPIGVAAILAYVLWHGMQPQIKIASVDYPEKVPANSEAIFTVHYTGGDIVRLERQVLQGSWKETAFRFDSDGKSTGSVTMKIRSPTAEKVAFRLTAVDAAGKRSSPFDVAFEIVPAPQQQFPGGLSRAQAPRITEVRHPRTLLTDRKPITFEIYFEDRDADVTRLEIRSVYGQWGSKIIEAPRPGMQTGMIAYEVWADSPGGGILRFTVIDAQGNRSAPYDARFTAVSASGARFAR